ncbi:MAG: Flp family type IVb pilin [Deltaproteobacteria bacterium]|nr:Flp family type IVb pilin [Deltaproteobacteria bacterium]
MKRLISFLKDEEGATAVEYGLIVGLIALAIITTVGLIGTNLDRVFGGNHGDGGKYDHHTRDFFIPAKKYR